MTVALAATWNPRGEMSRLERLYPRLAQVYAQVVIVLPPTSQPASESGFETGDLTSIPNLTIFHSNEWGWGRYLALQAALEEPVSHIHYADLDRLLRWVETRPEEWRQTVAAIQRVDCLIVGRTETAYSTHPQALIQTETLSNLVISYLVGRAMDVSAGSKGFSRLAAQFLIANSSPGHALGTDGEWPVLLHRAGFKIEYLTVDGLDLESADRYRSQAADPAQQRQLADAYDADEEHWARRVAIALEIIQSGLAAIQAVIRVSERENGGYEPKPG